MTDQFAHQRQALRNRVEARLGPLHEIDPPKSADEAATLTREDPDLFDALWDAGRIGPEALGKKEAK